MSASNLLNIVSDEKVNYCIGGIIPCLSQIEDRKQTIKLKTVKRTLQTTDISMYQGMKQHLGFEQ
jgi:hypothetical protein